MRDLLVGRTYCGRLTLTGSVLMVLSLASGCHSNDGWQSLFDGTTLDGWHEIGKQRVWRVEDGAIVGELVESSPYAYLVTEEKFTDFELKLRMIFDSEDGNSGIFFRCAFPPQVLNPDIVARDLPEDATEFKHPSTGETIASLPYRQRVHITGMQAEFAPPNQYTGALYDSTHGRWITQDQFTEAMHQAHKWQEWNDLYIKVVGQHVLVRLNDTLVSEIDNYEFAPTGRLALQLHSGDAMKVRFKDIYVRPLCQKNTCRAR
ncbi:MAG: DUF1080 domain-containing protein [Phycisphaerales bacterium]|nr:DUF1080 domain-containing protein [Phycisphaerales bacterium]